MDKLEKIKKIIGNGCNTTESMREQVFAIRRILRTEEPILTEGGERMTFEEDFISINSKIDHLVDRIVEIENRLDSIKRGDEKNAKMR